MLVTCTYSLTGSLAYILVCICVRSWLLSDPLLSFILHGPFANFYCNQHGYTAMIWAAGNGHKDVVEYLVSQGADKDAKNNVSTDLVDAHVYGYIHRCV